MEEATKHAKLKFPKYHAMHTLTKSCLKKFISSRNLLQKDSEVAHQIQRLRIDFKVLSSER